MPYRAPGLTTGANGATLDAWNTRIAQLVQQQLDLNAGAAPFLEADPSALPDGPVSAHWPADPAEPRFCLDMSWAQKLSDWDWRGRADFHNEYCEYAVETRVDANGRVRLKRFTATTELAEWWTAVAEQDPDHLRAMAEEVLGVAPDFEALYGPGAGDPHQLSPAERRIRFATENAGHGKHRDLIEAGVPEQPQGQLNRRNALFMCHPINGLDDLIYIVLFGAQPFGVRQGAAWRQATIDEIFKSQNVEFLACRNADPAAAAAAYDFIISGIEPDGRTARGKKIAFADPIGMYFFSFDTQRLFHNGAPVPASWTRFGRGAQPGLFQRLVFGPSDAEDAYLDEVVLKEGAAETSIAGGYQLARLIEVGPRLKTGPSRTHQPTWIAVPEAEDTDCSQADVCSARVAPAKLAYENRPAVVSARRNR